MKNILLLSLLLLAIMCATFTSQAQRYLGIHGSNYAGIMGADVQPASIVDGRFKFDLNLIGGDFSIWQNFRTLRTENMPGRSLRYLIDSSVAFSDWKGPDSTYLQNNWRDIGDPFSNSTKNQGIYNSLQIDIVNFMFHINPRIAVGFSPKIRMINSVDELNPRLRKLFEEDFNVNDLQNLDIQGNGLSQNSMAWVEYGFNYAQVLNDDGDHFFKAGARFKLLQGLGATYNYANQLDINLQSVDTASYLRANFSYGSGGNTGQLLENRFSNISDIFKAASFGFGADLGLVYEYRPKHSQYQYEMDGKNGLWYQDVNKYKLRAGVSLLDIGGIRFDKTDRSRDFSINATGFNLNLLDSIASFSDYTQFIDSMITNDPEWIAEEDTSGSFYMNTPTALSLQLDYHIYKNFYVNATGYFNILGNGNKNSVRAANQITVSPSYDFAWMQVAVPISYNTYSGTKIGLGLRLGPLTVGVTDYRTVIPSGKFRGGEMYASLRVPILYDTPQDMDNDKVSDAVDACIDVPGLWTFKGCPDTDGDGIEDKQDNCPETPGLKDFNGCPDTDKDGIMDSQDDCPEIAGLKQFRGCPDTDEDGIMDKEDDCPQTAGTIAFNGCPDTDGDGIRDLDDACPDVKGPATLNGCPDSDNDGILDFLDNCPQKSGPKENNGCPWPDTDGDGLLDKDDKCPNLAGPVKNKGCPYQDTDGDGIIDAEDECPATPGVIENKGCPKIEVEEQEILNTAFDNLQFETGKAIIKESSFESLDSLAALLIKKADWKLQISGHTDAVGAAQNNLILSKKRSEAVKAYIAAKGVEEERLNALFFGETMPIAENDTPEGRARNRRVEMVIIFD